MKLNRDNILKKYKWLREKKRPFIISADYDGLICASFLNHYLNWELVGYYDFKSIWLSKEALQYKNNLIWVDLNILPKAGTSLGGHIVSMNSTVPKGFNSSCNPNILADINSKKFENKFPFSTLIFLLWLHDIQIDNKIAKLFILHSDNTWMKVQRYSNNIKYWTEILSSYPWDRLFKNICSIQHEEQVDQFLYPRLIHIGASTNFSKLTSKYLKIKSRECKINPDWDNDIILRLLNLFGEYISWTPPVIPKIIQRVDGKRLKISLEDVKKIGLDQFIKKNKVFSYAITSSRYISYTNFSKTIKS